MKRNIGILEYWNSGILEQWNTGRRKIFSTYHHSTHPSFHHSIIPARAALRRGLTLIEVMLAVVILGIGSGVLMLATARCIAIISKSRHYSTAQRLILQVGAENPLNRAEVDAGIESGTFDDENGYRWEREIKEPENENRQGLYTVRTRVSWSDRGRDSFEEVITWYYIPPEEEL